MPIIKSFKPMKSEKEIREEMKQAVGIMQGIDSKKKLLADSKDRAKHFEVLALTQQLNTEQLMEFIQSVGQYETDDILAIRLKEVYNLKITDEDLIKKLEFMEKDQDDIKAEIERLCDKLHNLGEEEDT